MRSKAIAVGCSSALALGLLTAAAPAMAGEKQINDDISLKWNLKASVGAISRMESARKENLFAGDTPGGTSGSAVSDDGNLNYDGGEVVSAVAKAVGDINLQYRNYGLFVRAKGWYDYVQKEKDVPTATSPMNLSVASRSAMTALIATPNSREPPFRMSLSTAPFRSMSSL